MTTQWTCAKCGADWHAGVVPEEQRAMFGGGEFFSRRIAIYDREQDCTVAWKCPDCGDEVQR